MYRKFYSQKDDSLGWMLGMIVSYCIIMNVLNCLLDSTIWLVLGGSNNVLHWGDKVKTI